MEVARGRKGLAPVDAVRFGWSCRRCSMRGRESDPFVPNRSSVSWRSAAACVTASIPDAPRSNCRSAVAVSSTSRSRATVETTLVTRRTGPSRCSRTSSRWHPKSAIGPPPDSDRWRSHDRGSPGRGSNGSKALISANTGVPISPASMRCLIRADHRVEATIVRDPQRHATGPAGGNHAIAFGEVHRHRFLAEHVLAGLSRRNRLLGMEANRRRHVHRIDFRIGQQVAPVRIPPPGADLTRERFGQLGSRAADRHKIAPGAIPQRRGDALPNDITCADQAPAE